MPANKSPRKATRPKTSDLTEIPGIGSTFERDLARIGVTRVSHLRNKSAEKLFQMLQLVNDQENHGTSKNYLYVLRMAVYFADGGREKSLLKWSAWTDAKLKSRMKVKSLGDQERDRELIEPKTRGELRSWLKANHLSSPGVWVAIIKKAVGVPRVDLEELCEELVCFGWVDSRPAKLDATRSRLLCTPRSPKSAWSRLNKQRYERMETQKKLTPAGRRAKKIALENGQWNALDDVEKLLIPIDLKAELGRFPKALSNFDAFPPSVKRGILEWITQAKRTDTRVSRIKETARLAAVNKRANQWPRQ